MYTLQGPYDDQPGSVYLGGENSVLEYEYMSGFWKKLKKWQPGKSLKKIKLGTVVKGLGILGAGAVLGPLGAGAAISAAKKLAPAVKTFAQAKASPGATASPIPLNVSTAATTAEESAPRPSQAGLGGSGAMIAIGALALIMMSRKGR